jgi:hypothetical protein
VDASPEVLAEIARLREIFTRGESPPLYVWLGLSPDNSLLTDQKLIEICTSPGFRKRITKFLLTFHPDKLDQYNIQDDELQRSLAFMTGFVTEVRNIYDPSQRLSVLKRMVTIAKAPSPPPVAPSFERRENPGRRERTGGEQQYHPTRPRYDPNDQYDEYERSRAEFEYRKTPEGRAATADEWAAEQERREQREVDEMMRDEKEWAMRPPAPPPPPPSLVQRMASAAASAASSAVSTVAGAITSAAAKVAVASGRAAYNAGKALGEKVLEELTRDRSSGVTEAPIPPFVIPPTGVYSERDYDAGISRPASDVRPTFAMNVGELRNRRARAAARGDDVYRRG